MLKMEYGALNSTCYVLKIVCEAACNNMMNALNSNMLLLLPHDLNACLIQWMASIYQLVFSEFGIKLDHIIGISLE